MALDKQKILNELGNVVNQLQSADCGCMGKLFSNNNQGSAHMGYPLPTCGGCRRNCCGGHGFAQTPHSGDANNMGSHGMTNHCMGRCNPPKLYAETYNYLSDNLMKPVVNEVYNDLSSLNAANTLPNNPLAAQMGLSPQSGGGTTNGLQAANPGTPMMSQGDNVGMTQNQMGANSAGYANTMSGNQMMGNMAGMGPQIMSMMMGDGKAKSQSPAGNQGDPSQVAGHAGYSQQQMGASPGHNYRANTDPGYTQNAECNYLNQQNFNNTSGTMNNQQAYNMMNMNTAMQQNATAHSISPATQLTNQMNPTGQPMSPTSQQMVNPNTQLSQPGQQMSMDQNKNYGIHTQGVKKFNEIFPGVMKGMGGDLGFDPMSLAIQMNPANQHNTAMNNMQKLMMGDGKTKIPSHLGGNVGQPVNAVQQGQVASNFPGQAQGQPNVTSQHIPQTQQQIPLAQQVAQTTCQQMIPTQQTSPGQNAVYQQQQQVYSSVTGSPSVNQQQKLIDPNTGAEVNEPFMPSDETPVNALQYTQQLYKDVAGTQMINNNTAKEPLCPANASRNTYQETPGRGYVYNTLGQPVEMLSAKSYKSPIPPLPQTLSPQPESLHGSKYHIKNTMSKTSLFGNKAVNLNPSRAQLQKIYHQYKGSQSYTQQNISPNQVASGSYSQGQIIQRPLDEKQCPVEKVAGDTNANANEMTNKTEHGNGQIGDVPFATKPLVKNESPIQKKHRNGLQDMVYTAYPQSTSWSFHGVRPPPTVPHQYRLR